MQDKRFGGSGMSDGSIVGVDELLEETRGPLIPNSYAEIKKMSPVESKKKELVITVEPL